MRCFFQLLGKSEWEPQFLQILNLRKSQESYEFSPCVLEVTCALSKIIIFHLQRSISCRKREVYNLCRILVIVKNRLDAPSSGLLKPPASPSITFQPQMNLLFLVRAGHIEYWQPILHSVSDPNGVGPEFILSVCFLMIETDGPVEPNIAPIQ